MWAVANPILAKTGRFSRLADSGESKNSVTDKVRQLLETMTHDERMESITELIVAATSEVLRIPADRIHPAQSFADLGADSLLMVELALSFKGHFGFELNSNDIMNARAPEGLTRLVLAGFGFSEDGRAGANDSLGSQPQVLDK